LVAGGLLVHGAGTMFEKRGQHYAFRVDPAIANNSHTKVIRMIGRGKRVLEVGCATGYVSAYLSQQMQCEVVGIELDPQMAKKAERYCSKVVVGDVEKDAFDKLAGVFDVITFGDVLEHLVTPGEVLRKSRDYLGPDGYVLISLPNVAHYRVRLALLQGRFDYEEQGILDRTHLRFFTLRNARRMIEDAGFEVQDFQIVYCTRGTRLVDWSLRIQRFLRDHLAELVGSEFIFKAGKRLEPDIENLRGRPNL